MPEGQPQPEPDDVVRVLDDANLMRIQVAVYFDRGDFENAIDTATSILASIDKVIEGLGEPYDALYAEAIAVRTDIALACFAKGDTQTARKHFETAAELSSRIDETCALRACIPHGTPSPSGRCRRPKCPP
jgi:tetratricopeptide (TPR) repeat protein